MASPVAHSLAGITIGRLWRPAGVRRPWQWYLFCAFAANGPDLDFLTGLLIGQVNLLHRGGSHSLFAALGFGALAAFVLGRFWGDRLRLLVVATLLYASHLAIDSVCGLADKATGQPLLWPLSTEYYIAPKTLLPGILHGGPKDSFGAAMTLLFSWHNVRAVIIELAVFGPPAAVVWFLTRRREQSTVTRSAAGARNTTK